MDDEGYVVRIRGLPWSAGPEEIQSFLEGCQVHGGKDGIHFTFVRDGRPSGEAYIELETEQDLNNALTKDKHHMGKRYIEVFRSKKSEMEWVVKRSGTNNQAGPTNDAVVRLRGLPFGCSKEEIAHFFTGLEIVPNGITLILDHQGRTTGDAFVQFASQDIAERALTKHKEKIGHRYIEIFKSTLMDVRNSAGALPPRPLIAGPTPLMRNMVRPGPYDRINDRFGGGMGGGGYGRGRGRNAVRGYDGGYDSYDDYDSGPMMGRMMARPGPMGHSTMGGGYGRSKAGGMMYGMRSGGPSGRSPRGGFARNAMPSYDSQTGYCIHMRGLPFSASEQDIHDFFKPLNPVSVCIHYNSEGRASGEADVDFNSYHELSEAMKRDRGTMQHRYIELFDKSTGPSQGASDSYEMTAGNGSYEDNGYTGASVGYGTEYATGMDTGNYSSAAGSYSSTNYTAF